MSTETLSDLLSSFLILLSFSFFFFLPVLSFFIHLSDKSLDQTNFTKLLSHLLGLMEF